MQTLRDLDLVRALVPAQASEIRADDNGGMPTLSVRFSVFDTWYEIDSWLEGQFLERTVRGAFKKTIRENRDNIKILFDHGHDPQIGNKVLAPVEDLREDTDSPIGEGRLFDTSYNRDLLPGLEAKAYGSSFRFRVIKDEWNDEPGSSDHNPKGLPERTVKEVRLFEFGPVTFPANPDATAGVRCLTDEYYERVKTRNPRVYEDVVARARSLRTSGNGAAESTPPAEAAPSTTFSTPRDGGAAQSPADVPPAGHPSPTAESRRRRDRIREAAVAYRSYQLTIDGRQSRERSNPGGGAR